MKIIFLGKPGSGKGTYAQMISEEFNIPKITTGDLLRDEIKNKTELGKEIKDKISKGLYVDDDKVINLIKNAVKGKKDVIIDGFPRTLKQTELFKEKIDIVFYLKCSGSEIMRRLINRRICVKCDRVYNLITNPPKKEGICDICGSKLVKRIDETKEAIKQRLKVYEKETLPVIEFYKKEGSLIEINGDREINVVYKEIKNYISSKINR